MSEPTAKREVYIMAGEGGYLAESEVTTAAAKPESAGRPDLDAIAARFDPHDASPQDFDALLAYARRLEEQLDSIQQAAIEANEWRE